MNARKIFKNSNNCSATEYFGMKTIFLMLTTP